jgi:CheY-like chemotaxis protein
MSAPTLLLVEDEPNSVFFFEHAMKKHGMTNPLHVANDGREALDYLEGAGGFADRTKYPLPALVILDLKLPRATGFEVLQQIRQRSETRSLIVLMLTSSASEADVAKAYALGANAYLVKPLRLEVLEEVVGAIKLFWLTHNTPPDSDYAPS